MDISEIFELIKKDEAAAKPPKQAKTKRGPKELTEEQKERLRAQLKKGRETSLANRKALAAEREKLKQEADSDKLGVRVNRERAKLGLDSPANSEMLTLLRRMADYEETLKAMKAKSEAPKTEPPKPEPPKPEPPKSEPPKPEPPKPEPLKSAPAPAPAAPVEKPFDYGKLHKFAQRMRNNKLGGMVW